MESRFVTLQDGLRIHVLVDGAVQSPPLVLLHGYPVNCRLWRHCIPALAEWFRVYAPDLPGHGLSEKRMDVTYDLDFFDRFLFDFHNALELKQADLVGHDLGGMIGISFVVRHPERVRRFVAMDTSPYADWPFMSRMVVALANNRLFSRWMTTRTGFRWMLKLFGVRRPSSISADVADLYHAQWIESPAARRLFGQLVNVSPERMAEPVESLRRIDVPTLILWAEKDRVIPNRIARRLQGDIPDAEMVIVPDCGHFLQEEQPRLVVEHLLRFMREKQDA